ncbi:MAG: tetratricopeptide repeat protein [Stigonema ocellatum SAG 48.90 = DSM 106950]|nr:tetratricopeptide repeat protein [Stigonema ocellatum SAG 48.90 = DSM 106950]
MPTTQATIKALLKDKIGLAASTIGSHNIARAVEKRRLACDLRDLPTYLRRLQTSKEELEELIELVVVPETWFFRDRKPFTFLEHYVKSEWLPNRNNGILRLLSIPCSTGEEPYSLAMLLLNAGLTPDKFRIDAVDISKKALLKATNAIYNQNSFRGEDLPEKERYFQQTADGYELSKFVRNTVNFIHGNLLEPFFLANKKYNIIFCRNLLIYFDSSASSQAIDILDHLLTPKGLLFVGSAETGFLPTNRFVSVRYPFSFAYQKVADVATVKVRDVTDKLTVRKEISRETDNSSATSVTSAVTIPNLQTVRNLADAGRLDEAASWCKTYVSQNPTNAQAYLLLGEVYQASGDNHQAEQCFQKAIYLEPNYYEALVHLTLLKEYRGDRAGAALLQQRIQRLHKIQDANT